MSAALLCVLISIMSQNRYVTRMRGMEPEDVWQKLSTDEDKDFVIIIDVITTYICLYVPIRSCVLWVFPVPNFVRSIQRAHREKL